jgi:lipid A disaccharide synthetase
MQSRGFNSLFNISDLAIMGLAEVIPSIPNEDDYKLGVAHLTIRSVSTPEVLNYVSNQL